MGRFFAPDFGDFEITRFTSKREVRFSVPIEQWPEFEQSLMYQSLTSADFIHGIEVIQYYSDNAIYCQEVRFSIPLERWSEFESLPTYQQLVDYVHSQQIPERPPRHHGGGLEWEIDGLFHHPIPLVHRESFWVKVRKWFRRMILHE